MASIIDVSKYAHVSTATVSRVFNNSASVNAETRARVLNAAEQLGYIPKSPVGKRNPFDGKIVAVVLPDTRNAFYTDLVSGLEICLKQNGFSVLEAGTDESPDIEFHHICTLFKMNISALVLVPTFGIRADTIGNLLKLENSGIPVVLMDRDIRGSNFDGVFMDNHSAAYNSTMELLRNGHRNIAFLAGSNESRGNIDRFRGFCDAFTDFGLEPNKDYVINGEFHFKEAYENTKSFLQKHEEITAVFSSSRRMTSGCLFAFAELGKRIGEDISIVCCGRPNVGSGILSYIDYPSNDMGKECSRIICDRLMSETAASLSRRVFLNTRLVLRGSEKYNF